MARIKRLDNPEIWELAKLMAKVEDADCPWKEWSEGAQNMWYRKAEKIMDAGYGKLP